MHEYLNSFPLCSLIDLVEALGRSIDMIQRKEVQPAKFNDELKEMYSWVNVAERTEKVYDSISQARDPPLIERLRRCVCDPVLLLFFKDSPFDKQLTFVSVLHNSYYGCGVFVGKLFCIMIALDYLFWVYLEWILPRDEIEIAPKFPYKKFKKVKKKNGNTNLRVGCLCGKVLLEIQMVLKNITCFLLC